MGRRTLTRKAKQAGILAIRPPRRGRRQAFAARIPAQVWADLRGEGLLDERVPADS